jgi:flagellar biosynthesis protein
MSTGNRRRFPKQPVSPGRTIRTGNAPGRQGGDPVGARDGTGGRKRAVALTYDSEMMPAPKLSATGQGTVAERIIKLAREHDIPIRQDPDLVVLLAQLDVGQIIPPELYPVMAEVLAFVYRLKAKYPVRQ